jgi:hypothetical protein
MSKVTSECDDPAPAGASPSADGWHAMALAGFILVATA